MRMNGSFSRRGFLFVCMFVVDFIESDETVLIVQGRSPVKDADS